MGLDWEENKMKGQIVKMVEMGNCGEIESKMKGDFGREEVSLR